MSKNLPEFLQPTTTTSPLLAPPRIPRPSTARAQIFLGPGIPFDLREIPIPSRLEPDEVLVEISLATICGSDLHSIQGRRGSPTPCVLGHEGVGVVVDSQRLNVHTGQRITWSLADSCGHCLPCTTWNVPQKCHELFKYGHAALANASGLNGCYASHIILRPGTAIFQVPPSLPDAWVAPANCALATIANACETLPTPCNSAWIQGAGLLGLYACAWLKTMGVEHVFCSDISEERLAWVPAFGGIPLHATPEQRTTTQKCLTDICPHGIDFILEVAGASSVLPDGIAAARPGAHYMWVGMVHPETPLSITGESVLRKCLTIKGIHNYTPAHLASALHFLEQHHAQFPFDRLVSPPLPLIELPKAIDLTLSRSWLRVAIAPNS